MKKIATKGLVVLPPVNHTRTETQTLSKVNIRSSANPRETVGKTVSPNKGCHIAEKCSENSNAAMVIKQQTRMSQGKIPDLE
jgi:hypothetical protein